MSHDLRRAARSASSSAPPPSAFAPARSASSSALPAAAFTTAHARRPSRLAAPVPPSAPADAAPPPAKTPRRAAARVADAVDAALLALGPRRHHPRHPRKRPPRRVDRGVAATLAALFVATFLLLFALIKRFFGAAPPAPARDPLRANLRRVADGLPPLQFWPGPASRRRALAPAPAPILADASVPDILEWRAHPSRAALSVFARRSTSSSAPPALSLVAACRDRTAFLQTALPAWLAALAPTDELVLVDWGTAPPDNVPLAEVVRARPDPRVALVTVRDPGPWVLSRAYNLAVRLARGRWLLKLDCDTLLRPGFRAAHPLPPDDAYYRFHWRRARDDNQQHLNGVFLARTDAVRRVNAYDERITTYGWDDEDLYTRLEHSGLAPGVGLKPLDLDATTVSHMKHGDDLRAAAHHLVMGPTLETQVNQQAAAALQPWTVVAAAQRTTYRLDILSRDARFLRATVLHAPTPLLQQIPAPDRAKIIHEATNRLLHDIYGFPWGVLAEINRSRAELVRSLAALGRSTHWQSGNGFIFAEVGGTVAERLLGMASAVALAVSFERPLFLAWSSGSREDPTPRVTDFFDVDGTHVMHEGTDNSAARIYQIGRWKCRSAVVVCAQMDTAFNTMNEFRTGGHADETRAAQGILDVLKGKVKGKRNVLLRLEGAFPLQNKRERAHALASLTPSPALAGHISKLGDLSDHLGVYIGHGVREKGVEAMVRRLEDHASRAAQYFITGATRAIVDLARKVLPSSESARAASDIDTYGSTQEIRDTIREIAELYALSSCKNMVNDGRPPAAVLDIVSLLKQRKAKFV